MATKKIAIKCKAADYKNVNDFVEFQGNLKKLTKKNYDKLKRSILNKGFIAPIFIWKNGSKKSYILDGHQRLTVLRQLEAEGYIIPDIPVAYIEAKTKKDAKEKLLYITSQYGEIDKKGLDEFIIDIDPIKIKDIRLLKSEIDLRLKEQTINDDEVPDVEKAISKEGDIWELGSHRVLCGDSTKDIEKVLKEEKVDMVFTDPPYGVSYSDKNEFLNTIDNGKRNQTKIENDDLTLNQIYRLWNNVFSEFSKHLSPVSSYYICSAQGGDLMHNLMRSIKISKLQLKHIIIWVKNNHVLGRCDYNYKHEPILYGWKNRHKFYGNGKFKTSVWEYDKPNRSKEHPTMKPVELVENAILNSSEIKQIIFDPFLGSGSTLIACEKTDRICYGIEIDPHYCDVIVNRYINWCEDNSKKVKIKRNGKLWQK